MHHSSPFIKHNGAEGKTVFFSFAGHFMKTINDFLIIVISETKMRNILIPAPPHWVFAALKLSSTLTTNKSGECSSPAFAKLSLKHVKQYSDMPLSQWAAYWLGKRITVLTAPVSCCWIRSDWIEWKHRFENTLGLLRVERRQIHPQTAQYPRCACRGIDRPHSTMVALSIHPKPFCESRVNPFSADCSRFYTEWNV